MAVEAVGARIKAIRDERGDKQPEFAAALNAAAKRLRIDVNYDGSKVSKLEGNKQFTTLEDVMVIASLDPQKRGREWLAWGMNPTPVLLDPRKDRGLSEAEEQRAIEAAARERSGRKRPGTSGRGGKA